MMHKSKADNNISLLALTASVLLHLLLFVQFINNSYGNQALAPELSTRVSLRFLTEPVAKPQADKSLPTKPRVEEQVPPLVKQQKNVKPEIKKVVPLLEEQVVATAVSEKSLPGKSQAISTDRKVYLDELVSYIEANKYYPRMARARGIEGDIEVSFELLQNGDINLLTASGGPSILREAAETSISRVLPLPKPPETVECPMQVSYVLQYQIR